MNFKPWKGRRYGHGNSLGLPKRLLILGESHYGDNPRSTITQDVVPQVFGEDVPYRYRFFTSLFMALCGVEREPTREALEEFCHAIAFYNFIQEMMDEREIRPGEEQWEGGAAPFFECLDTLKPSHIVACGFTLWDNLPHRRYSRPSRGIEEDVGALLPDQGKRQSDSIHGPNWIGRYGHAGGSCLVLRLRHPSVAFSAPKWHPVLQRFFKLPVA